MDCAPGEFILSEFIGLEARVKSSADRSRQGIRGRIIDETKNAFVFATPGGKKTVPKKGSMFFFIASRETVDGSFVAVRPEDRTKMLAKRLARRR